eukprot:SAG31_NODE_1859_length_7052_cov_4.965051_3_plen_55_part_00
MSGGCSKRSGALRLDSELAVEAMDRSGGSFGGSDRCELLFFVLPFIHAFELSAT